MKRRTVSLVLGSGGARGLAHIGVIEALRHHHFDIRSIAGTSMGALIGGIYAAGKLDVFTRWVTALDRMDVIRLLDFAFDGKGLFKGERIINLLRDLIGERNIEDLPISFTAVATDLHTQKEVWFNKGPLFDAIRSSISVPTVFTPYGYDDRRLLDGALVNPIPIAPTLNDKTDLTIVVSLNAPPVAKYEHAQPAEEESTGESRRYHKIISQFIENLYLKREKQTKSDFSMLDIATRSMDTMQNVIARFRLAAYSPDLLIEIPSNICAFHEFHRAHELLEFGRHQTNAALKQLKTSTPTALGHAHSSEP